MVIPNERVRGFVFIAVLVGGGEPIAAGPLERSPGLAAGTGKPVRLGSLE